MWARRRPAPDLRRTSTVAVEAQPPRRGATKRLAQWTRHRGPRQERAEEERRRAGGRIGRLGGEEVTGGDSFLLALEAKRPQGGKARTRRTCRLGGGERRAAWQVAAGEHHGAAKGEQRPLAWPQRLRRARARTQLARAVLPALVRALSAQLAHTAALRRTREARADPPRRLGRNAPFSRCRRTSRVTSATAAATLSTGKGS